MSREARVNLMDWQREEVDVKTQAELLSLNRSSLYYQPVPPSAEEVAFKHRIDELDTAHPYYGYRRIAPSYSGTALRSTTKPWHGICAR